MGEIKSAWEIAMEKIDELDELSPEELKIQKDKKYTKIAQALVDKYFDGVDLWQLNVELDKYGAENRDLLSQLVVSKLASAIELGNNEKLSKILEGISYLEQMEEIEEIANEIKQLFQEYAAVQQKGRGKKVRSPGEILQQLGISGTAIGEVNPNPIVEEQPDLGKLDEPYKERLEKLKQFLLSFPPNEFDLTRSSLEDISH